MNFHSLRTPETQHDFKTVLFQGLSPDGSLFVPESLPKLDSKRLTQMESLHRVATTVLAPFIPDIEEAKLHALLEKAWDFPIPLQTLDDDLFLIEEFHGPTLAFKDLGARFMAAMMDHYLEKEGRNVTILVATSGDTGSAVAHGFFGAKNIDVFVLYPSGKVSPLQEKQMTTLGGNITAMEVTGNFDDCQALVKQALQDTELVSKLGLTTANSINMGRLLPQIVFYVWAWVQWETSGGLYDPTPPSIVVPSGNFGNLTACLYAKKMGIPIGPVVAATNANRVVPDYIRTGEYDPKPTLHTHSSAMDVGDPSNWTRIAHLFEEDWARMRSAIHAVTVPDNQTLKEIKDTLDRTGILLDPHTAVGVYAARNLKDRPAFVAATAHPAKFPEVIKAATGKEFEMPEALAKIAGGEKQSIALENDYAAWRDLLESHN